MLIVSIKRGGILLGAFDDGGAMNGFVYSMPAIKDGRPTQWSHMLGVTPEMRAAGLGARLKLAQRAGALAMGLDLIEWTYDPLQAINAHLNFAKLGVVVEEYEENIYGESSSPLHSGTPTDRFVAEWQHQRAARRAPDRGHGGIPPVRDSSVARHAGRQPVAAMASRGCSPGRPICRSTHGALLVEIPVGFTEMLERDRPPGARVADGDARRSSSTISPRLPGRGFLPRARGAGAGSICWRSGRPRLRIVSPLLEPLIPILVASQAIVRRARAGGCGTPSGRRRRCS